MSWRDRCRRWCHGWLSHQSPDGSDQASGKQRGRFSGREGLFDPAATDVALAELLAAATPEVTTTNFGGSEKTSIEQWCAYIAELTGFGKKSEQKILDGIKVP